MAQGIPSGSATGGRAGEKWVVEVGRKKQHTTCQFIQHFREQLLAGRVKNEEFLEPEKCVSEVDTARVKSRFSPSSRWTWLSSRHSKHATCMGAFTNALPPESQRDSENSPECPKGTGRASTHLAS